MLTDDQIRTLAGGTAVDVNGDKIGKIGQIYVDDQTGQPAWVSVNTGLFGTSESLAPLQSAVAEDDTLRLGYSKDQVKDAPNVDADQHLDESDEQRLYQHYGLDYGAGYESTGYETTGVDTTTGTGTDTDTDIGTGTSTGAGTGVGTDRDATYDREAGTVGHDTSGPTTDDAMTRSEERLHVGTERREAGRVRLRKHVVTDTETVNVPVSREEVRIEREPITEGNVDRAMDGPAISDEEHEVVLTEERPVVEKETVPVERVRLGKEKVTEEQTVSEQVRKEEIDTDGTEGSGRL
jgi:uncharacterized protein (TIGR02271 family)